MRNWFGENIISVFGNSFDSSDVNAIKKVLFSHLVGTGKITETFENDFKKKIGFEYACAVSSCTNAFWLLLKALDLKSTDEIIIPNIHFFGIKNVMELLNIKYIITDVDKLIPNITLKQIAESINNNTKVIIFLEYGGYPVYDIKEIKNYLKKKNRQDILLILDAANSPFTKYKGKYSALEYDYAIYSFDMNKILVTGDGGMVLSNNNIIISKIRSLAYYGIIDKSKTAYEKSKISEKWWEVQTTVPSLKLVMNNITASLGLSQLNKIDKILEKRTNIVNRYIKFLKPLKVKDIIDFPITETGVENNVYLFWLILKDEKTRNSLAKFLLENNIYTTVKYQPLDINVKTPNALSFYSRIINLPLNQNITDAHQSFIIEIVNRFFNHAH